MHITGMFKLGSILVKSKVVNFFYYLVIKHKIEIIEGRDF